MPVGSTPTLSHQRQRAAIRRAWNNTYHSTEAIPRTTLSFMMICSASSSDHALHPDIVWFNQVSSHCCCTETCGSREGAILAETSEDPFANPDALATLPLCQRLRYAACLVRLAGISSRGCRATTAVTSGEASGSLRVQRLWFPCLAGIHRARAHSTRMSSRPGASGSHADHRPLPDSWDTRDRARRRDGATVTRPDRCERGPPAPGHVLGGRARRLR